MSHELHALFQDLFDSKKRNFAKEKMEKILSLAQKIGGPIEMEAELLYMDILKFLDDPNDPKTFDVLKEHALRLDQETKEI